MTDIEVEFDENSPLRKHFKEKDDLWKSVIGNGLKETLEAKSLAFNYNNLKSAISKNLVKKMEGQFSDLGINPDEIKKPKDVKTMNETELVSRLEILHMKKGIELMTKQIEEINHKPKEKQKDFVNGAIVTLAGILLGGLITGWLTWLQKEPPTKAIEFPKVVLVKDTVYIKNQPDTSLVRIVKRK